MVGDAHRTYCTEESLPIRRTDECAGKTRLMYECSPMAYIIEQAGGRSSDGNPEYTSDHTYRSSPTHTVFLGSDEDVNL